MSGFVSRTNTRTQSHPEAGRKDMWYATAASKYCDDTG